MQLVQQALVQQPHKSKVCAINKITLKNMQLKLKQNHQLVGM